MPNVQYRTPDDGQRRYPKHVEFYNRINLDNWCVWLDIKRVLKSSFMREGRRERVKGGGVLKINVTTYVLSNAVRCE